MIEVISFISMSYILFPMFQNRFQVFKSPFYHPLIKRIRLFPDDVQTNFNNSHSFISSVP